MAERGKGYQSFVEAHRKIVERLDRKKELGEKVVERQELPQHTFEPAVMFDCLTNSGKRYFQVQHCVTCGYHRKGGSLTYDTGNLTVLKFMKNVPDEGCIKKSVDNATDTTVN